MPKPIRKIAFVLLFILAAAGGAEAFHVGASPTRILQGDAFVLKVSGAPADAIPAAAFGGRSLSFASCGSGCFVAVGAADAEMKPGRYTCRVTLGVRSRSVTIVVRKAAFRSIALTLPEDKVFPSDEDMQRIEREESKLAEVFARDEGKSWEGRFIMPVNKAAATAFGTKRVINRKKISIHKGLDLRGKEGDPVRASNSGRVVLAEELFFGGNTLILDHGRGIFTIYMHLSSITPAVGETVAKGTLIGRVGATGRASGPHLHFGTRTHGISVNPESLTRLKL